MAKKKATKRKSKLIFGNGDPNKRKKKKRDKVL